MKKSMLIIPGAFVPTNDTVTLLTYRRLKHLNIEKDVFAFKYKSDPYIKKQLHKDKFFKSFNIQYVEIHDNTVHLNNIYRYMREVCEKSDHKKYDYIYTSSAPFFCHVCGYKIKKKYPNVIWCASFSDPIKNSPYNKHYFLKEKNLLNKFRMKLGSFLYMENKSERVAIKYADKLIFICEEQRDFTANQYPKLKESIIKKSIILGLHYDDDWGSIKSVTNKKIPLIATHCGRIYGLRKIDMFLEALKEIKEEDNSLSKKIVFHQYGGIQPEYIDFVENNHLEDVFIIHETTSYGGVVESLKKSNILVIFDTIITSGIQPYLPSKLAEYIATEKPIFGICCSGSPLYRILKVMNHETCNNSKEDIKKAIYKLLSNNSNKYSKYECEHELYL